MIVSIVPGGVRIRDPEQRGVLFGFDAWRAFLADAKKGRFDLPDDEPADGPGRELTIHEWIRSEPGRAHSARGKRGSRGEG